MVQYSYKFDCTEKSGYSAQRVAYSRCEQGRVDKENQYASVHDSEIPCGSRIQSGVVPGTWYTLGVSYSSVMVLLLSRWYFQIRIFTFARSPLSKPAGDHEILTAEAEREMSPT